MIIRILPLAAAFILATSATAQQVPLGDRSLIEAAATLKNGQFVWAPERSPAGPTLLIVNLATQRAVLFRNGVPIAASSVSTGKPGYETPTGVFTILQKAKEHYSRTYDNAPMPNMQRLTWKGIALHAGKLPGYPASHGCIRLPHGFSELLFGATKLGMTVVITSIPGVPETARAPQLLSNASAAENAAPLGQAAYSWHPDRSTSGMVSVVVSAADRRAIVMRGGVEIGSAPVRVNGDLGGGLAYVLRAWDTTGQHWMKLQFSGHGAGMDVSAEEGRRFEAPAGFRHAVAGVLRPGSVVIVTPESLKAGSPGQKLDVIKDDVAR
ncbi:L,D-transpeptidase family protein [Sphingomonas sp. HDW15A]|uniref:L,D-transpeptidase family protein n=1 Tax=Sphingomonas sp. HDW15A TaxID=2714942 RepID=UPI00140D503C|nr:L,D-transpeptidase family protein [Sphingomonas sp. HDW15A]QIK95488.1 L,D-transpeptidase family protein [Sphingomonas sp. HDW15A]